jgi:predicted ATP-dependent serine protease
MIETLQVDLGGGLRPVRALDLRLAELAKLGLTRIIIPKVAVDV